MISQNDLSGKLAIDTKGLDELRQSAKQNSPESIKTAAKQFEALFMNMMLKSMRQASPQDGAFDNEQTKMYTSMLDQQLSQTMASRGVGLADVLVRQLSSNLGSQGSPLPELSAALKTNPSGIASYLENRDGALADLLPPAVAKAVAETAAPAAPARSGSKAAHVQAFQDRLASHAEQASQATGIPAKFMLGQAALESGWGKREIRAADGTQSYNLFGIKATSGWKGKVVEVATTEYVNGVPQRRMEKFRAYDSYADAFKDYGRMLKSNPRYENVLANAQDVAGFAQGLQKAGYATDPRYADKLMRIIKHSLA